MAKQKLIIRVDGGSHIGLGHISRCCALADMLKEHFDIFFYTRATSKPVLDDIKNYCTNFFVLDSNVSYEEEADEWVTALQGNETVVLDGYNFTTYYQQKIKQKGCKLVCIDDIHAYHFVADVVINHAPGIGEEEYSVEPYTKLCLGTKYVLLKIFFLAAASKKSRPPQDEASAILICLGGADPNDDTRKTFDETIQLFPFRKINVVVGAAYLHFKELEQLMKAHSQTTLHVNIKAEEMLLLMQQSGIAITAASTISLEYICTKGSLFLKCIADNQREIYHALIEKKCAYPFDIIKEYAHLNELDDNQARLIDGKSGERVLEIFRAL